MDQRNTSCRLLTNQADLKSQPLRGFIVWAISRMQAAGSSWPLISSLDPHRSIARLQRLHTAWLWDDWRVGQHWVTKENTMRNQAIQTGVQPPKWGFNQKKRLTFNRRPTRMTGICIDHGRSHPVPSTFAQARESPGLGRLEVSTASV